MNKKNCATCCSKVLSKPPMVVSYPPTRRSNSYIITLYSKGL
nr:MAG TPA: hypothetical protein [Caudoviricetes sp.]